MIYNEYLCISVTEISKFSEKTQKMPCLKYISLTNNKQECKQWRQEGCSDVDDYWKFTCVFCLDG